LILLQLFERQVTEDGDLSTREWADDRSPLREGEKDADTDDYLPIPRAKPVRKGKHPVYGTVYHLSDDEDDEVLLLDPIDAIPISWSPPCVPAKIDAADTSRKRAEAPGSDAPPAKRSKKTSAKPSRLKTNLPTEKG